MRKERILVFIVAMMLASASTFAQTETVSKDSSSNSAPKKDETAVTEESAPAAAALAMPVSEGGVGGGASLSPLLSDSFQTDLATGAATANIPIVVPPGRKNMQPNVALSYSNNNPNGICGVGWALTSSSIQRSTKKGAPVYQIQDTFIFSSSGSSGELVPIDAQNGEYRQKIETGFMRYRYDSASSTWSAWDKNGTKYTFGSSAASRVVDPADATKIFAWHLDRVTDIYGNYLTYIYEKETDGQIYLSKIEYTGNDSTAPILTPDKSIEFVYESTRPDTLYNNRSGWEMRTNRRLKEILIKVDNILKWKYTIDYVQSVDTARSLVSQITVSDGVKSLPPKRFTYQTLE